MCDQINIFHKKKKCSDVLNMLSLCVYNDLYGSKSMIFSPYVGDLHTGGPFVSVGIGKNKISWHPLCQSVNWNVNWLTSFEGSCEEKERFECLPSKNSTIVPASQCDQIRQFTAL